MAYRAPNVYARFVKTAGTVNTIGSTRIMGLIGTGLNYYEVYNEAVTRSSDKPYDKLANSNVFEIMNVSKKAYVSGKNTSDNIMTNYQLKDGKYVTWAIAQDPTFDIIANASASSEAFKSNIVLARNTANDYLVEDGEYIIEVTYVSATLGTYRIINNLTTEIVGEYAVSDTAIDAIPGFKLTINSTSDINGLIAVGDYVKVVTTAGLTQQPSTITKLTTVTDVAYSYNVDFADNVEFTISTLDNLVSGKYTFIMDKTHSTFNVINNENGESVYEGVIGGETSYPEVIPGVTFILNVAAIPDTVIDNDAFEVEIVKTENASIPAEKTVYYVSYKYKKADEDYDPKLFVDYDDVVAEYGNYDVTVSGIIVNSLSLGAEIAFTNGVNSIVCVQAKNDSDAEMNAAMDKLQRTVAGVNNINTIIPLTESAVVGAYGMKHVNFMSSEEQAKERMLYLGAYKNQPITKIATVTDKSIGMIETAKSYNNERVVFVVPGTITKDIRDLRTGKYYERKLPGCYAAIGVAALGLKNDPAEPLTNKTISGFKGLTTMYMESEKNLLAAAGCLVLDQSGSVIKVRHGITTNIATIEEAEITLVQIKDYVIDACRNSTATSYIGNKNRPSIVADVEYTISNILNKCVSQEILLGFSGLSVKRSSEDPRQIDVKFEIEAVYPLNYITISFGFSAVS